MRKSIAIIFLLVLSVFFIPHQKGADYLRRLPVSSSILGPPKGLISIEDVLEKNPSASLKWVIPSYQSTYPCVDDFYPADQTFPASWVLKVEHARVYSEKGILILQNDQVLDTVFEGVETNRILSLKPFNRWKLPFAKKIDKSVAVIATSGHWNYYHWMVEILPRLELVRLSGYKVDLYYLPPIIHAFQKESLKAIGVDPEMIFQANNHTMLESSWTIFPDFPSGGRFFEQQASWMYAWLRKCFLPAKLPIQDKYLYISRKKAKSRRIKNEDELLKSLEALGFESVCTEDLSVKEQAILFASAKIIVAPHGAAFTNIIFCQPNTKIVELFSPSYKNRMFAGIAHQLNFTYKAITGMVDCKNPSISSDYSIDHERMIEVIESMLQ